MCAARWHNGVDQAVYLTSLSHSVMNNRLIPRAILDQHGMNVVVRGVVNQTGGWTVGSRLVGQEETEYIRIKGGNRR